ncbi:MAG TPA: ABC transporter permease [Treponemataceae bacterium]|nr:ABC transporter permease [Treponemataceae bacterium]HPS44119.1 ABC transporter permease [Treponemataceae bacterium]
MMKAFWALFATEAKLAIRSGDMILFGLLFPVGIMLLIGFISGPEATRLGFGGTAAVGICAAGLMGIPLTFANYRHDKILKRFRVTPVSPATLVLADTLVQAIFAVVSGFAVYLVATVGFGVTIAGSPLRYALTFAFTLASIFSLGFLIASLAPSVKAANLACTVLYFPMLFLSGATVPYEILPRGLKAVADWFPLTEGIKLLKGAVLGLDVARDAPGFLALALVAAVSCVLSAIFFRWE